MQVMVDKKVAISKLTEPMKAYPQVLKNVRVKDKKAARTDADVCAAVAAVEAKLGDNGRILVRESGTEPVIRVMVEAESERACARYVEEVVAVLYAKGYAEMGN